MLNLRRTIACVFVLMMTGLASGVAAQTAPTSKLITAPAIMPIAAWSYYGSPSTHTVGPAAWSTFAPEILALARSLGCPGPATSNCRLSPAQFTQNVADYVRNNIAVEFRFGLGKGARGALIDQSGTPFDQAELMVKVLRAGGVSATYQVGTITVTAQQFGAWTGLVNNLNQSTQIFNVNAQAACQFLADGAIPTTLTVGGNSQTSCSGLSGNLGSSDTITMGHIWVSANGATYDPSFKQNTLKTGINLPQAMGCGTQAAPTCGSTLDGLTGGTTGTVAGSPSLQNLNEAALRSQLSTYAQALEATVKATPGAQMTDVVGGAVINIAYAPAANPSPPTYSSPVYAWSGDIPDAFRTTVAINYNGLTQNLFIDEIAGRRVRLLSPPNSAAAPNPTNCTSYLYNSVCPAVGLFADDIYLTGLVLASNVGSINLSIIHPYASNSGNYANESVAFPLVSLTSYPPIAYNTISSQVTVNSQYTYPSSPGSNGAVSLPMTIIAEVGDASPNTEQSISALQAADPNPAYDAHGNPTPTFSQGAPPCGLTGYIASVAYPCGGDEQPLVAAKYLAQGRLIDTIVGGTTNTRIVHHHALGFVFQFNNNDTFSISSSQSISSTTNNAAGRYAAFEANSLAWTALEGSVFQQQNDTLIALSPNELISLANKNGVPLVNITNASALAAAISSSTTISSPYSRISTSTLLNYPGDRVALLNAAAAAGSNFILPENAAVGCLYDVSGDGDTFCALPEVGPALFYQPGFATYMLGEAFKGGGAPPASDPVQAAFQSAKDARKARIAKSNLGVSTASGDITLKPPPDLVTGTGSFPESLPFQRIYRSAEPSVEALNVTANPPNLGGLAVEGQEPWTSYVTAYNYSGPDSDSLGRLGGGWTHNYQITARIANSGTVALGDNNGVEASGAIAAIFAASNLLNSPGFHQRLSAIFIANWLSDEMINNSVAVDIGGESESFALLPDGSFDPPAGSSDSLSLKGQKIGPYISTNVSMYDYSPITISLTKGDGSVLSFSEVGYRNISPFYGLFTNYVVLAGLGIPAYKADTWIFPDGNIVTFNYATQKYDGDSYLFQYQILTSVSNSLGRVLSFSNQPVWLATYVYGGQYATPITNHSGYLISSVTDENNRSVAFSYTGCSSYGAQLQIDSLTPSVPTSQSIDCGSLSATLPPATPGGPNQTLLYSYTPGSDSPDPSPLLRASYRLRRWYSPSNQTTPYQTVAYDGLYRAATVTDILGHVSSYYPSAASTREGWKRTDEVDAVGNTSTSWFDQWNDQLQAMDPLGRISTNAFDGLHRKVLTTGPLLDCSVNVYDVRSNVLSTSHYPINSCSITGQIVTLNASPPTPIVNSSTYGEAATVYPCVNPITCNKPTSQTDGLGNVTNYGWNAATGQLSQILKPADNSGLRPETDFAYTLYGSGTQFSLLSQKNEKVNSSQNILTTYVYNTSNKFVLQTATVDSGGGSHLNLLTCFKFDAIGNLISTSDPRATSCP